MREMSSEKQGYLSAALRHCRDAEVLLTTSPDQSWHLAGFGPECMRKACLEGNLFDKAIGHGWDERTEGLLDFAVSVSPQAWRYRLEGWGSRGRLQEWNPQHRYDKTGTHSADADALVTECADLVDRVHQELWMDGAIRRADGGAGR